GGEIGSSSLCRATRGVEGQERRLQPSPPKDSPKPVNTKWGDDDDSPLDMEFPSLAGGARAPERADQQDQSFRPNRGG
ncbi:unnamed protein product, partial [Heterosigma akashiwo]